MMRTLTRMFMLVLLVSQIQACSSIAWTGASAVYNRRSLQNTFSDQYITLQIFRALKVKTREFKYVNISIATYNGEVLLSGQVDNMAQKEKVAKIAASTPGVKGVYNQLKIASPSSPLTKISDTWITTKVKAKLIATDDVDASQIKVVTENGTVYLMGIVKPEEAEAAASIASTTDGVQSVVKIFSYMHVSKQLS